MPSQLVVTILLTVLLSTVSCSSFVTRNGSKLMLDGEVFTFSGVNIYWLGQDENNPNSPNGESPHYSHPSMFRIDDVLFSALSMGSRVVRSHTLGKISSFERMNLKPCCRREHRQRRLSLPAHGLEWNTLA